MNEIINNNFIKYMNQSQENINDKEEKNNSKPSTEKNEEIILPRIDEVISEPNIYLLT